MLGLCKRTNYVAFISLAHKVGIDTHDECQEKEGEGEPEEALCQLQGLREKLEGGVGSVFARESGASPLLA